MAVKRNNVAMEHLMSMWNGTVSTLMASGGKKKQAGMRNRRLKENHAIRYLNIPLALRSQAISSHFSKSFRQLVEDCHWYVYVRRTGQGAAVYPKLRYLPSDEEMIKMIERAADSASQPAE